MLCGASSSQLIAFLFFFNDSSHRTSLFLYILSLPSFLRSDSQCTHRLQGDAILDIGDSAAALKHKAVSLMDTTVDKGDVIYVVVAVETLPVVFIFDSFSVLQFQ